MGGMGRRLAGFSAAAVAWLALADIGQAVSTPVPMQP
jgi:hypothetical protein